MNRKIMYAAFAFLAASFFSGCMTVKPSSYRNSETKSVRIDSLTSIAPNGVLRLSMPGVVRKDFVPSGVTIHHGATVIYIDPVKTSGIAKADVLLISHGHEDHFSLEDIHRLMKDTTVVYCPQPIARRIKRGNVIGVKPGDKISIGEIEIIAIPAYNAKPVFLGMYPHGRENVGYILRFSTGSLYFTGDTDLVPEMRELKTIDTIILPIPVTGGGLTMNMEDALELIRILKPLRVLPVHYNLNEGNLEAFMMRIPPELTVHSME